MEVNQRPFQPVSIGMNGVETGIDRFTKNDYCELPPLAYWRNNLTGLSQRFNLYFIASGEDIVVYRPDFPFQKLKSAPQLLIPPTLANPKANGYINPDNPHAINHLIVGDLGTEEVVLVCTDSGNVAGYHTKSISEAIKKHPYRFSTNARSDYVGVRAFFSYWVHESAWGLAIHSKARMIAVSANTPHYVRTDDQAAKVTVFAFALQMKHVEEERELDAEGLESTIEDAEWHDWNCTSNNVVPPRQRSFKITLAGSDGHKNNIPSVSFVNTPQDNDGQWLLSTDIAGEMKLWQIWRGSCFKTWNFADRTRFALPWLRDTQGGWLVAALDPYSFRPATSMAQFCGHSKATQYHGYLNKGKSYNISHIVRLRTPGNSLAHPAINESSGESDAEDHESHDEHVESWSETEDLETSENRNLMDLGSETTRKDTTFAPSNSSMSTNDDITTDANNSARFSRQIAEESVQEANEPTRLTANTLLRLNIIPNGQLLPEDDVFGESDSDEIFDTGGGDLDAQGMETLSDSDLSEDDLSQSERSVTSVSSLTQRNSTDLESEHPRIESDQTNPPSASPLQYGLFKQVKTQSQDTANRLGPIPCIPVVHCTASHLRLLKAPEASSPHIFCANILKQMLPAILEGSAHARFDRLNMIQQIPELGIVLIATQIGRCAVCSLTKNVSDGTLGLRVDWTLPTKKQERAGLRPIAPLLGIAIGPIQGRMEEGEDFPSEESSGESEWGQDGILEGVKTSFSAGAVVLQDETTSNEDAAFSGDDQAASVLKASGPRTSRSSDRAAKRTRLSSSSRHLSTPLHVNKRLPWPRSCATESWRAVEHSRRYRLMLTYSDMTVLTYEITRSVELDDIAPVNGPENDLSD